MTELSPAANRQPTARVARTAKHRFTEASTTNPAPTAAVPQHSTAACPAEPSAAATAGVC